MQVIRGQLREPSSGSLLPLVAINERWAIRGMISVIARQPFQRTENNEMKRLLQIALAMIVLGISSCDDGRYPISGKTCAPDDPVRSLDAQDCTVVPTF
jgi:hypothetical protein